MKAKIENLKVQGCSFEGEVYLNETLTPVTGYFDLQWERQYFEVSDLALWAGDTLMCVKTHKDVIDFANLIEQIHNADDGTWYDDHLNAIIEASYTRNI